MTRSDNRDSLLRAAVARHDSTLSRGRAAIEELDRRGEPITFSTVARHAGVSRGWLYNQLDLREAIMRLRRTGSANTRTQVPVAQMASIESLRERLDSARHDASQLRAENVDLRNQLSRALGEQRLRH